MAKGPSYRVAFRRRKDGKTDYQQRRNLVLSGMPRLVVRGSLRNISVQLINAEVKGDKVVVSAHSYELAREFGWKGGGGNLSAAYLTGLLCGYKAAGSGVKEAVLDMGLHAPTKGSRVFAALRGVLDAGVMIPHEEDKLPDEKRVLGQHITEYAKQLSSVPESYQRRFAEMLSRGLRPEEIVGHFSQVKQKISSALRRMEVPEGKEEGEKPNLTKPKVNEQKESERVKE